MLLTGKAANTHFWLRILLLHFWSEGSLAVQIQDGSAVPSCAINQSQIYSYKQTLQQEINFLICRSYVRKQLLSWAQHTETAGYFVSVSVGTDTTMFSFAFRDYTLTDFSRFLLSPFHFTSYFNCFRYGYLNCNALHRNSTNCSTFKSVNSVSACNFTTFHINDWGKMKNEHPVFLSRLSGRAMLTCTCPNTTKLRDFLPLVYERPCMEY